MQLSSAECLLSSRTVLRTEDTTKYGIVPALKKILPFRMTDHETGNCFTVSIVRTLTDGSKKPRCPNPDQRLGRGGL